MVTRLLGMDYKVRLVEAYLSLRPFADVLRRRFETLPVLLRSPACIHPLYGSFDQNDSMTTPFPHGYIWADDNSKFYLYSP